jgi:hypothetical protein
LTCPSLFASALLLLLLCLSFSFLSFFSGCQTTPSLPPNIEEQFPFKPLLFPSQLQDNAGEGEGETLIIGDTRTVKLPNLSSAFNLVTDPHILSHAFRKLRKITNARFDFVDTNRKTCNKPICSLPSEQDASI